MFLARVERLPVTSRSHVTDVTDVTDKCKISIMMIALYRLCRSILQVGLDRLCWHNFEHNRQLKELRIMLA